MIRREASVFIVVGALTVIVDYIIYSAMISFDLSNSLSKATGFLSGTLFSYFANRYWTFGHVKYKTKSSVRFMILYLTTLFINIAVNDLVISNSSNTILMINLAFVVATISSAFLNFVGMKYLVFKEIKS
tara:strand:+ start:9711 stop:10100 length:390 start_codon:yes stop_codon:yes gene_type:complete